MSYRVLDVLSAALAAVAIPAHALAYPASPATRAEAPAKRTPLLYANYSGNTIEIYAQSGQNQTPIGSISSSTLTGVDAMVTDTAGNLYVANCSSSSDSNVQVFAPGSQSPSFTYDDTAGCASDVAVDRDKVVVSNQQAVDGSVTATVFAKGIASAQYTIHANSGGQYGTSVALDRHGNCYLASESDASMGGWVSIFHGCAKNAIPRTYSVLNAEFVFEVRIDRAGDVVLANFPNLDFYRSPNFAAPINALVEAGAPFAFAADDSTVWTVDSYNTWVIENVRVSDGAILDTITLKDTENVGSPAV